MSHNTPEYKGVGKRSLAALCASVVLKYSHHRLLYTHFSILITAILMNSNEYE